MQKTFGPLGMLHGYMENRTRVKVGQHLSRFSMIVPFFFYRRDQQTCSYLKRSRKDSKEKKKEKEDTRNERNVEKRKKDRAEIVECINSTTRTVRSVEISRVVLKPAL